jgi:DNA-binding NarL/FixJ family response regulator
MQQKLNCVIIDDDKDALRLTEIFCKHIPFVNIVRKFLNPNDFLEKNEEIDFDLCILDINMPDIDGIQLANLLGNKMVIFVTGEDDKIKYAIDIAPLGIVKKTAIDKLKTYLERALKLKEEKIQSLFKTDKGDLVLIHRDILMIKPDEKRPSRKVFNMRSGEKYRLSGEHNFHELTGKLSHVFQVNKDTCISEEIVLKLQAYDCISIKPEYKSILNSDDKSGITIGEPYMKEFKTRFPDFS